MASPVDLWATEPRELSSYETIVVCNQCAPPCVAELNGPVRGFDDVREQNSRENARWFRTLTRARKELFHLVNDRVCIPDPRAVVLTRELDVPRVRDPLCQVPASAALDPRVP